MNRPLVRLAGFAALLGAALVPMRVRTSAARTTERAPSKCLADSNFQRLAFWVGDWEVVDSTGAHYAVQRVHAILDSCAITADWTSRGGYEGMNVSAFDRRSGEWRQVYLSNQAFPEGVELRRSDPTYSGPGLRFVALLDPGPAVPKRSRVTILPLPDHRAMQLFEDSNDGGKTWHVQFKAEHRPLKEGT